MALPGTVGNFTKKGKFYTTTKVTNKAEVAAVVAALRDCFTAGEAKQVVWILSGTHGTDKGELVREKKFFFEDKSLEGQTYKSIDVYGFTKDDGTPVTNRWKSYLGKSGIVILAWCYSEQSRNGWMKDAKVL